MAAAFAPLRSQPTRWLFVGFVALLLAPIVGQGLDRPLSSLLGAKPSGVTLTLVSLVIAFVGWLVSAVREKVKPPVTLVATTLAVLAIGFGFGLHLPGFLALTAVAGCTTALTSWLPTQLPVALDGLLGRHRILGICYVFLALVSIVQVARVSVFMADPLRTDAQLIPGIAFLETHSCLTAYVHGYELARDGVDNLYLVDRWPSTLEAKVRPETPFSPFDLDAYFYPPPFLLISALLAPLRGDFLAQRAAWFGLSGLLLAAGFWIAARGLGGSRWHRPLLLFPLFFASLPALSLLQVGNAQALVVVASVLAMLAFERDRPALGGFALALATMAKVSPGILGVTLIMQKRWRAVAWTAGFGALLLLLSIAVFGTNPLVNWIRYALPRLSSGQAFVDMLNHPPSVALNFSPSGLIFKLRLLGIWTSDPWPMTLLINHVVTLCAIVLAVIMGLRQAKPAAGPLTARSLAWMALLFVSALRSPFAPSYVEFSLIWGLTFLSVDVERKRHGALLFFLFAWVSVVPPLDSPQMAIYTTFLQTCLIVFSLWLVFRRDPSDSAAT